MQNLKASFEEFELTESDYVLNAGSAWVRVNDLVLFIVNHGDRMSVRVFEHGTAYDTPLDAIEFDCNSSYSQTPHDPGCPAVDGFGCRCAELESSAPFQHSAPYSPEFLGAQPPKAGQDY